MTRYLVLGLGMQGTAAAHDLILRGAATELLLVDSDGARLEAATKRLKRLTRFENIRTHVLDVGAGDAAGVLAPLFEATELCVNCLPYRFSVAMTRLALDAGTHICDLGGNTAVVREQLELAAAHPRGKELAVLPDCGLMPGMGNLFAAWALEQLGDCDSIHVRCGGLPQNPRPPLDYQLLFNVGGLTNEYFGLAQILRGGELVELPTFSELEQVSIEGLGPCEAFITSGGLSTTPWNFAGRVRELTYKTVRYAGHWAKFKLLVDLGLLEEEPVDVPGADGPCRVAPRAVLHRCLEEHLTFPGEPDLAFLRCTATAGEERLELEIFDRQDEQTGFTAMERTTAYAATACAYGVIAGKVRPGAGPLERCVDTGWFLEALAQRTIPVTIRRGTQVMGG